MYPLPFLYRRGSRIRKLDTYLCSSWKTDNSRRSQCSGLDVLDLQYSLQDNFTLCQRKNLLKIKSSLGRDGWHIHFHVGRSLDGYEILGCLRRCCAGRNVPSLHVRPFHHSTRIVQIQGHKFEHCQFHDVRIDGIRGADYADRLLDGPFRTGYVILFNVGFLFDNVLCI